MAARAYAERPESRVRGQAALAGVREARTAARRRFGSESGWYGLPDWRLDSFVAARVASRLEALGWRSEAFLLGQGIAYVTVRDLGVRGMPLVATLRTEEQAVAFLRAHPERRRAGPRREPGE
jgi:hypothetical protein